MVSISKRVHDVLSLYLLNEMVHDVLSLSNSYVDGKSRVKIMPPGLSVLRLPTEKYNLT
jgi:hypothetical protein